jgi:hypothetical protein
LRVSPTAPTIATNNNKLAIINKSGCTPYYLIPKFATGDVAEPLFLQKEKGFSLFSKTKRVGLLV